MSGKQGSIIDLACPVKPQLLALSLEERKSLAEALGQLESQNIQSDIDDLKGRYKDLSHLSTVDFADWLNSRSPVLLSFLFGSAELSSRRTECRSDDRKLAAFVNIFFAVQAVYKAKDKRFVSDGAFPFGALLYNKQQQADKLSDWFCFAWWMLLGASSLAWQTSKHSTGTTPSIIRPHHSL